MWIGGYWNENGWHWSDGFPWQYQSWLPGEPSSRIKKQNCVQMFYKNDPRWDDNHCRKSYPFFCEIGETRGKEGCGVWQVKACD